MTCMDHLDETMILRCVSGGLSIRDQLAVDAHLAQCNECLQRVKVFSYVQTNLDSLWSSWTAAEHGAAHRRWQLAKALRETSEAVPALTEQVKRWFRQLKEGLEFSIKVLVDQSQTVASVAASILPPSCEFQLCPSCAGIGSPDEQSELASLLLKGSRLLAEDRPREATDELLRALQIDARNPQAAMSQVRHQGQLLCQAIVDSRRGRILVKFWPQEGCRPPGLALLIPESDESQALAARFEVVESESYVQAEFDRLESAVYSLQIEPTPIA